MAKNNRLTKEDLSFYTDRSNMEANYDRYFSGYYNPYEKRTDSIATLLENIDNELREAGKIN